MNKFINLIKEKCPDGVDYVQIKSIAEVGTGSSDRKDAVEDGEYPFYVRSKEIFRINSYEYDETAIVIPGEGGIGEIFHFVQGKYALHQRAYRIHLVDERINAKFLYYYMFANFKYFIMKKAVSSTVTSIRKPMIEEFEIPVPPIGIQQEIVRILDKFTALEVELQTELDARKKQYDEYLNMLMDFSNDSLVKYMSVGELFEIKNGLNKEKEAFGRGKPIINFTDVFKKRYLIKGNFSGLVDVNEEEMERYSAKKGDVFFTRTSETREDIGMSSTLIEDVEGCVFSGFVLRARPLTNLLLPKFCSYYFSTNQVRRTIMRYASFTTRATTTGPKLSKIMIPILSICEQQKIVDILDRMDAICNDNEKGLPAEIEARHKQYEYYRDKLLTFERKVV